MMRHTALVAVALALVVLGYVELSGGWYTYRVLPPSACDRVQRGAGDLWPEEPVPNQPNPCFVRARRFPLP